MGRTGFCLLDAHELNIKFKGCVWWYRPLHAGRAITHLGRHCQLALVANPHAQDALVPPLDHLANTCSGNFGLRTGGPKSWDGGQACSWRQEN